jgi:hypothetical protein
MTPIPNHTLRTLLPALFTLLLFAGTFHFAAPETFAGEKTPAKGPAEKSEEKQKAPEKEKEKEPSPVYLDWWDWWFPEHYKDPFLYPRRLAEPLRLGRNNFLHHLVLLPPLEGFRVVKPGRFALDQRLEGVRESHPPPGESGANRFDATFFQSMTQISLGLTRDIEIRAGFDLAYFVPDNDDSLRLTQKGEEVLGPGDFDPKPNLGNLMLGVKILSAFESTEHLGLAPTVTLKIPVGKKDFLSSGRGDVAVVFHGTWRLGLGSGYHVFGHLSAGVAFFDEENVFPKKVYLSPASVYGASLVFPLRADQVFLKMPMAFMVQAQGNAHVFREMDAMNSDPHTLHFGLRLLWGSWALEGSAGFGISPTGAADFVVHAAVGSDF